MNFVLKLASINKVEHRNYRCLIQASSQLLIEYSMIKKTFKLAFISPLLHLELSNWREHSGEANLAYDMLLNRSHLDSRETLLNDSITLFHDSTCNNISNVVTLSQ